MMKFLSNNGVMTFCGLVFFVTYGIVSLGIDMANIYRPSTHTPGVLKCAVDDHFTAQLPATDGVYLGNGEWRLKNGNKEMRYVKSMLESCVYIPLDMFKMHKDKDVDQEEGQLSVQK